MQPNATPEFATTEMLVLTFTRWIPIASLPRRLMDGRALDTPDTQGQARVLPLLPAPLSCMRALLLLLALKTTLSYPVSRTCTDGTAPLSGRTFAKAVSAFVPTLILVMTRVWLPTLWAPTVFNHGDYLHQSLTKRLCFILTCSSVGDNRDDWSTHDCRNRICLFCSATQQFYRKFSALPCKPF